MAETARLVVFMLDGQRYGLRLAVVERVVRAVEIVPLPTAPEIVLGIINLAGRVVPVVNTRKRFRLAEKEMELDDRFVIAQTARRTVALLVDSVPAVLDVPASEIVQGPGTLPQTDYFDGVARLENGMLLIHDLEKFLSLEEERELDAAVQGH